MHTATMPSPVPPIFKSKLTVLHKKRLQQRTAALAQQNSAVWCGAMPCPAVRCGAGPCWAVLGAVLYLLFRTCQVSFDEESHRPALPRYTTPGLHVLLLQYKYSTLLYYKYYIVATLLYCKKCTHSAAQLSSAITQQRAAQCGVVPCLALRCCAIAVLSFERTTTRYLGMISSKVPGTRYRYVRVYSSLLSSSIALPLGPHAFLAKLHPCCLSECDICQHAHNTTQGNQLCTALGMIKSLVEPNIGYFSCFLHV